MLQEIGEIIDNNIVNTLFNEIVLKSKNIKKYPILNKYLLYDDDSRFIEIVFINILERIIYNIEI